MAQKRAERLRLALAALAAWAFAYACYRGYYALGGQAGMIGRPVSEARFRQVNAGGAVILLLAALIPATVLRRGIPGAGGRRRALLAGCWLAAVGFCMHAVVDGALRILSLRGLHAVSYPPGFWATIDRRTADLQDLLFNEPWFLVEGCLWALVGILVLRTEATRRPWLLSAVAGCFVATAIGLLTGLGAIDSVRLG